MILEIFLKTPGIVGVISAVIPTVAFLGLLIYFVFIAPRRIPKAKIVDIKDEFYIIGVAAKTSKETFAEDDLLLWKEYKRVREKKLVENKKEEHSFVAAKLSSENYDHFEYIIGDIVENLNHVPVGMRGIKVTPSKYVCFPVTIKDEKSWAAAIDRIEKHIHNKWLPKSPYELDTKAVISELQYHDKRSEEITHTMKFYMAIRPKSK